MSTATDLMPYVYFVSYAHHYGFGMIEVKTSKPVSRFVETLDFRQAIAASPNFSGSAQEVIILNFILLSGPKEDAR